MAVLKLGTDAVAADRHRLARAELDAVHAVRAMGTVPDAGMAVGEAIACSSEVEDHCAFLLSSIPYRGISLSSLAKKVMARILPQPSHETKAPLSRRDISAFPSGVLSL